MLKCCQGVLRMQLTLFAYFFVLCRPINDPLHLYKGDMNQNIAFYKTLCEGDDRQSMKLSKMAQRAQEDFYGEWVGQMVRIAKVRPFRAGDCLIHSFAYKHTHPSYHSPASQ